MKINRTLLMIAIGMMLVLAAACSFSASTAKISTANTARMAGSGYENTTTFKPDEVFYLLVTLANAPDDTVTKAVWYAVDAAGVEKNTKIDEAQSESGDKEITFDLSNTSAWPVGKYKVELFLNDKLDRTLEFAVEGSPAAAGNSGSASGYLAYLVSKASGQDVQTNVFGINEPFYLVLDLSNAPAGTTSKASWYAVSAEGVDPNLLIDEVEMQESDVITFNLSNNGPWPVGTYKVEVYINNALDQTLQFTVSENPAPAGGSTTNTGVSILNAYTAREINGSFENTAVYGSNEVFHCFVQLSQVSPTTKIKAEWKAVDTDGYDANTSLYIAEGTSASNELVFDLSNQNPWPKGKYSVELYLDNQYQGIIEFEVE